MQVARVEKVSSKGFWDCQIFGDGFCFLFFIFKVVKFKMEPEHCILFPKKKNQRFFDDPFSHLKIESIKCVG